MLTSAFSPVVAFGMPNASELMIIMVLVFVFFGAGRLPDVLKQFGKGVKEFKDASDGVERKGRRTSSDEESEDGDDDERAEFEEFRRQRRAARQIGKDTTRDVRPTKVPEPADGDADGEGDNDDAGYAPPSRKR